MRRNLIILCISALAVLIFSFKALCAAPQRPSENIAIAQEEEPTIHEPVYEEHGMAVQEHHKDIDKDMEGHKDNELEGSEGFKEHGHSGEEEVPIFYLLYWGVLIFMMVIILIYFVSRFKSRQLRPMVTLAVFLVIFVLSAYLIEMTPVFSGRFDPVSSQFVKGFHEKPNLGFLRFVYKFFLGIFLTFFAFLNMDRKRFYLGLDKAEKASEPPKASHEAGSNKKRN
ncbi:hypothetical protein JXL19_02290 [bacterium]|nr:hypothetical protein [bacterium]